MKKILHALVLVFVANTAFAQFGPARYIDTLTSQQVAQIETGDINNDGFDDIVTIINSWPLDMVTVYLNDKNNGFLSQDIIVQGDSFKAIESIAVADMDNDGWDDVVFAGGQPSKIVLAQNSNGTFTNVVLDSMLDFTTKVLTADFDGNGRLDIVSLQHTEIVVYLQNLQGQFGVGKVVDSGTEFYALVVADFDKNGSPDIAAGSSGFDVILNLGGGNFSAPVAQGGLGLTFGLQSADMDNDGDNDIVAWETLQGLLLYENNGNGAFAFKDTIIRNTENFKSYVLADLNLDGKKDVLTTIGQQGKVIWFEGAGNATFKPLQTIHQQTGHLVYEIGFCDANNDGKPDPVWGSSLLAVHFNQNLWLGVNNTMPVGITVYPNPANGSFFIQNSTGDAITYTVFDVAGRSISGGLVMTDSSPAINAAQGVYYVTLYNSQQQLLGTQKLVVR